MAVNVSPNMNLPIPVVGTEPGPDYASDVNNCLSAVDSHNHTPGQGVQLTPDALNINSALPMNNNNLTATRSVIFQQQPSLSVTPGALNTDSSGNLYFTNGTTPVQLTNGTSIAGAVGSIAGLSSPASATYVSGNQTFVWQSGTNVPANVDAGSVIFRNLTASSNGVTVSAPAALGSNYSLVLPPLPSSQKIMTLDSSGNMSAPYVVDNSTLTISSNALQVATGGITGSNIASGTITTSNISNSAAITGTQIAGTTITGSNIASTTITPNKLSTISAGSNSFAGPATVTATTYTQIIGVTVPTIVGRPVLLSFSGSNFTTTPASNQDIKVNAIGISNPALCKIFENGVPITGDIQLVNVLSAGAMSFPASVLNQTVIATVSGSATPYTLQVAMGASGTPGVTFQNITMRGFAI